STRSPAGSNWSIEPTVSSETRPDRPRRHHSSSRSPSPASPWQYAVPERQRICMMARADLSVVWLPAVLLEKLPHQLPPHPLIRGGHQVLGERRQAHRLVPVFGGEPVL